ncbi:MAG: enoyl-CoA hydratase/isomerase family protein [Acidimicrobiales bacterium]
MAAPFETISVELTHPVAVVTLRRPDALNAITPTMLAELDAAFASLEGSEAAPVVVLTGEGRAFSAGVDLKALGGRALHGGKVGDLLDVPARRVIERIEALPAVVIAKVNGYCFTGALELALACDLIVAAEEAVFGDTHAKFGLRPTWGMSQRLPALVGLARARELSYTARSFTGAEAASWGLAARACPRERLDEVVAALAEEIAANSRGSLAAYKDLYRAHGQAQRAEELAYEAASEFEIADTEERIAAFR